MHIHFCHLSHAHIHINTHKYAYLWNVHVHKSVHTSPYILEYINEICNVVLFFFYCIAYAFFYGFLLSAVLLENKNRTTMKDCFYLPSTKSIYFQISFQGFFLSSEMRSCWSIGAYHCHDIKGLKRGVSTYHCSRPCKNSHTQKLLMENI